MVLIKLKRTKLFQYMYIISENSLVINAFNITLIDRASQITKKKKIFFHHLAIKI